MYFCWLLQRGNILRKSIYWVAPDLTLEKTKYTELKTKLTKNPNTLFHKGLCSVSVLFFFLLSPLKQVTLFSHPYLLFASAWILNRLKEECKKRKKINEKKRKYDRKCTMSNSVSFKAPVSVFLWLTCTNMLISFSLYPVLVNCRQIIPTPE